MLSASFHVRCSTHILVEMSGGVSNVLFEDSTIQYAGIALKLSAPLPRGGSISNITWRRVAVKKAGMLLNIEDGNSNPSSNHSNTSH